MLWCTLCNAGGAPPPPERGRVGVGVSHQTRPANPAGAR
jgi:hypothetical protein